jgi:hypothetical protein
MRSNATWGFLTKQRTIRRLATSLYVWFSRLSKVLILTVLASIGTHISPADMVTIPCLYAQ